MEKLYRGWISQQLTVHTFKWVENRSKFGERFRKEKYNEESDKEYILELDVQYQENLHNLHYDLLSLSEIIKIEKSLVAILQDKIEYVIHIKNHG